MISRLVAAAVIVFTIPEPPPLNEERMLDAIKAVENWDGRTPGAAGEWGAFQMKPDVWRKYSKLSQRRATPAEERIVARAHLHWVRGALRSNRLPDKPWFIAAAWGAGVDAVKTRTMSPRKIDYADRAETIYDSALNFSPTVPRR